MTGLGKTSYFLQKNVKTDILLTLIVVYSKREPTKVSPIFDKNIISVKKMLVISSFDCNIQKVNSSKIRVLPSPGKQRRYNLEVTRRRQRPRLRNRNFRRSQTVVFELEKSFKIFPKKKLKIPGLRRSIFDEIASSIWDLTEDVTLSILKFHFFSNFSNFYFEKILTFE